TPEADRFMEEVLRIHPLAVEDVWADIGLPKVEDFGDYVQIVMHGVREEDVGGKDIPLALTELDMISDQGFTRATKPPVEPTPLTRILPPGETATSRICSWAPPRSSVVRPFVPNVVSSAPALVKRRSIVSRARGAGLLRSRKVLATTSF